jgi:hypothetical protein
MTPDVVQSDRYPTPTAAPLLREDDGNRSFEELSALNEQTRIATFKSDFLNVLSSRGFIQQVSEPDALDPLLCGKPVTAYIGFDCTARSLHVGSLVQIMLLYWLQQA